MQLAHNVSFYVLIGTMAAGHGCAKFNKRHKHNEPVFGTYPASASQHPGLASVSPQVVMPTTNGPMIYETSGAPVTAPPITINQPALMAPSGPASAAIDIDSPMPPQDPKAVNVEPIPMPPTSRVPFSPAPAQDIPKSDSPVAPPAINSGSPPAGLPPATPQPGNLPATPEQPGGLPAINSAPPANLPSVNDLPAPPVDLPPPVELPKSTAVMPPISASPFANRNGQQIASSNENKAPVLTLSQPGDSTSPPPAPAVVKPSTNNSTASPDLTPPGLEPASPSPKPVTTDKAITSDNSNSQSSDSAVARLEEILSRTSRTLAQTSNYRVQVNLQEQMNGKLLPPDNFTLSKRREPFAVLMQWSDGKDAGREVMFSPVDTKGMIQIRMPKGLIPRISMAPDSLLVRSKSRHPITEAGADSVVERLTETLNLQKTNHQNAGQLQAERLTDPTLGPIDRVTHRTFQGELWVVDLDATTGLPLTIHATDAQGQLLEHYEFRGYQLNQAELMTADAFDPNARWGQQNLLGKFARGNSDRTTK